MKPTVVVLMSTYNGEKFLREQIDSVLSQQEVEVKIIIRDDGSCDGTLKILNEYAEKQANIIILKGKNCGAEMSFHFLCQYAKDNAKADFYAFCDQDDVWLPRKLKVAVDKLQSFEASTPNLYFSNLRMVDCSLQNIRDLFADENVVVSKRMALIQIFTYGCTCVFNHMALQKYCEAQFSKELAHDNWIYVLCVFLGNAYYSSQSQILYRQHRLNLSGRKVSGTRLAYQRIKRASKGHWGHDFELYSSMMLRCFPEELCTNDVQYISRIANYRKSLKNKMSLLFSPTYRTGRFSKDLAIKIRIIANQL